MFKPAALVLLLLALAATTPALAARQLAEEAAAAKAKKGTQTPKRCVGTLTLGGSATSSSVSANVDTSAITNAVSSASRCNGAPTCVRAYAEVRLCQGVFGAKTRLETY